MPVALGLAVCPGCIRRLAAGARLHCCKPGALQGSGIGQAVAERRSHSGSGRGGSGRGGSGRGGSGRGGSGRGGSGRGGSGRGGSGRGGSGRRPLGLSGERGLSVVQGNALAGA
jgi:hypothetical protein